MNIPTQFNIISQTKTLFFLRPPPPPLLSPATTDCLSATGKPIMTTRVHPNSSALESSKPMPSTSGELDSPPPPPPPPAAAEAPAVLTVWLKSLLFNCSGFTVFDSKGNLIFRVDEYARSGHKGEIVLMNAGGDSILTIRRKKLSLGEHWLIYGGDESSNPLFSVKKRGKFTHSKSLAHVIPCASPPSIDGVNNYGEWFDVEGSYAHRCCLIYDGKRRVVAEIRPKEAAGGAPFGLDVFRLVVQPGFDVAFAMAIVILLEEMFGSS